MNTEVKVEGLDNLLRNLKQFKDAGKVAAAAAIAESTVDMVNYAKTNHPFQNQTGNLEASIHEHPVREENDMLIGEFHAGMNYAPHVEYGTSRSAPYPFMLPAAVALKASLIDKLKAAIERAKRVVKVTR